MCDPATAMIVGSTAIQTVGAIQQGDQQNRYYNHQADQADADAAAEIGAGQVRAGKVTKAGVVAQGAATAGFGGAGIDVGAGSGLAVKEKLERNIQEDAMTELLTGQKRARALQATAQGYRAAGKNAQTNAMFGAAASLLGGTANYMKSRGPGGTPGKTGTGMTGTSFDPNW